MKKQLIIDLPDTLENIVEKVANYRKAQQRQSIKQAAQQGLSKDAVSEKLTDEEFLIAEIRNSIIADYTAIVVREEQIAVAKKVKADLEEKLKK